MANYLVVEWSNTGNVLLNLPQLEALASRSVIAWDGLQWETQCSCSIKQNFGKALILSIHGEFLMSFMPALWYNYL